MDKILIQSDPLVMMGKPVIAGTRINVELIFEKLAVGESIEQIISAHSIFDTFLCKKTSAFNA